MTYVTNKTNHKAGTVETKIKTKNLDANIKGKSSTTIVSLDFIRGDWGTTRPYIVQLNS